MYLVEVAPIARGSGSFTPQLSYFSKDPVEVGTLVTATIRARTIHAIVLSAIPVRNAKLAIKDAGYTLKKIQPTATHACLTPAFMRALRETAHYHATSAGELLHHTLPRAVLSNLAESIPAQSDGSDHSQKDALPIRESETFIFQAKRSDRFAEYKNLARTAFADNESLFIVVPNRIDAERALRVLSKNIDSYLYLFHGGLSAKQMRTRYFEALAEKHPIIAIMTPGTLSLPRNDIGTIVVERESAPLYKQHRPPFIDFKRLIDCFARESGARLILADLPLSVTTMHRYEQTHARAWQDVPTMLPSSVATQLIDMRTQTPLVPRSPVAVVSSELQAAIRDTIAAGGQTFLFGARRGLAPVTVCNDCGTRVSCLECGAPVVLHKSGSQHLFVCHACGAMRSAQETCKQCTSWKLTTLGIGVQLIDREIGQLFPDAPRILFDRDSIKTHRHALNTMEYFYETPGAILIGTELALPYLPDSIALSGIVSLDSLLSMPSWNIYERILSMIMTLRNSTERELIVQTRKPDEPILGLALKGSLGAFYRQELEDRKSYGYPPFSTLLKITASGSEERVHETMQTLHTRLALYGFSSIPHTIFTPNGLAQMHGFLRLGTRYDAEQQQPTRSRRHHTPTSSIPVWPNDEIIELLNDLRAHITVEVDPDRIL